tara:strand:- start:32 stop:739 length:708 start_codon:yes stop_codon:yes gene_type:complete
MALPVQKAPTFKCELPVSGLKVKFRPFLVKEQQHLLITRESQDQQEIFDAIVELIKSVTNGEVDASKLPMADLEYLFLQTRARSVGETVNIPFICQATKDCDGVHSETVDLTEVEVNVSEMLDNKVQISDSLIVELTPPRADVIYALQGKQESDMVIPLMRACLTRIYDEEEVYEMSDHRDAEIDEFVYSLQVQQFEKISEYFGSLPQLSHDVKWTCHKCGGENHQTLRGLDNFF